MGERKGYKYKSNCHLHSYQLKLNIFTQLLRWYSWAAAYLTFSTTWTECTLCSISSRSSIRRVITRLCGFRLDLCKVWNTIAGRRSQVDRTVRILLIDELNDIMIHWWNRPPDIPTSSKKERNWGRQDLNLQPFDLESKALPLSHRPILEKKLFGVYCVGNTLCKCCFYLWFTFCFVFFFETNFYDLFISVSFFTISYWIT